jgi:hypothetical protein
LRYKIIGAPKKFRKWPRALLRPRTDHACPQKPNPSHETVPLSQQGLQVILPACELKIYHHILFLSRSGETLRERGKAGSYFALIKGKFSDLSDNVSQRHIWLNFHQFYFSDVTKLWDAVVKYLLRSL